jgi:hypothetical protein
MREIAVTQGDAGLTTALFEAMADVFSDLAGTELAQAAPEDVGPNRGLDDVLERMRNHGRTNDDA